MRIRRHHRHRHTVDHLQQPADVAAIAGLLDEEEGGGFGEGGDRHFNVVLPQSDDDGRTRGERCGARGVEGAAAGDQAMRGGALVGADHHEVGPVEDQRGERQAVERAFRQGGALVDVFGEDRGKLHHVIPGGDGGCTAISLTYGRLYSAAIRSGAAGRSCAIASPIARSSPDRVKGLRST